MTSEQWEQAKGIFGDALDLDGEAREAFVREAAKDNPDLVPELLRLLKESERESDLLSRPALADARALSQDDAPRFAASTLLARRFQVVRFIARGGMGEVYEAEDIELGERVALKAIRPRVAANPELRALFKREIQLARRVTHPNVCRIFDLAQHEDPASGEPVLLLSMELIEGETLAGHLRLNGPLTYRAALPLIEDIAAGLQAVHNAGIVHGDLKPGNVMLVTRAGETSPHARVMDFGMAFRAAEGWQPAHGSAGETLASGLATVGDAPANSEPPVTLQPASPALRGGTPDYFAPELNRGEPATMATDVYALGLVIGEMLGMPRDAGVKPDVQPMPARWARILRRCLATDPRRRPGRPADVAAALRSSLDRRKTWRIAAAGACAAALLLSAARNMDLLRGTANHLLLTETADLTVRAASPDGRLLAATSFDTGDLIVRNADGGKNRRLTHKATSWRSQFGGAYGALFSPDGRQLIYHWMTSRTSGEIRIIGVDGKGERTLYRADTGLVSLDDWSTDGARVLLRLKPIGARTEQAAILSLPGGAVQILEKQPAIGWGGTLRFDRDGRGILFDARTPQGSAWEIHRLSSDGVESTLVEHAGKSSLVGWSPDRRRLIYSSDRMGRPGIWAVPVSDRGAESEPQEIVPDARDWDPLGISRTGSLFYRRDSSSVDVYTAVLDLANGRTVSPPRRVTERFVGSYAYPNWSEDGRRLVFDSNRSLPAAGLGIYDLQTGRIRELPLDLLFSWRPQWVEHSSAVVVAGKTKDGREGQFRINPQTGEAALVRSAGDLESAGEGAWSRDGRIQFNRFRDFRRGIFRLDMRTGERRVLYVPPPGVDVATENLALSPDERTLAFHARRQPEGTSTLMLIPADGGEARPLLALKTPESFWYGSFTWTPDSRRVLISRTRTVENPVTAEMTSEIWQVPVDGSAASRIDFPAMFITCLRLNPDGKTIAFAVRHWRNEIWVMQKFL